MNKEYTIRIYSDTDYENLLADIEFGNNLICTISQERGIGKYDIEICPMHNGETIKPVTDLEKFEEALQAAKRTLKGDI